MDEEEIQTFRFSEEFLFIGTQTGKILTYINSNPMNGQTPLPFLGELELHRSGITKLYFDEQNSTLYSASFDNQILKYKIEKSNFDKAVREFISLIGHEKWIWDLGLTKNEEGKELIVTVDENGFIANLEIVNPGSGFEQGETLRLGWEFDVLNHNGVVQTYTTKWDPGVYLDPVTVFRPIKKLIAEFLESSIFF